MELWLLAGEKAYTLENYPEKKKQLQEGRGYFDSQVEGAFHCGESKKQKLEANSHMTSAARKKRAMMSARRASSVLCNLGLNPENNATFLWGVLPTSTNLIKIIAHRHAQKLT